MKNTNINIVKAIVKLIALIIISKSFEIMNTAALPLIAIFLISDLLNEYQLRLNGIDTGHNTYRITTTGFILVMAAITLFFIYCIFIF